jgi:hypothetical protein
MLSARAFAGHRKHLVLTTRTINAEGVRTTGRREAAGFIRPHELTATGQTVRQNLIDLPVGMNTEQVDVRIIRNPNIDPNRIANVVHRIAARTIHRNIDRQARLHRIDNDALRTDLRRGKRAREGHGAQGDGADCGCAKAFKIHTSSGVDRLEIV